MNKILFQAGLSPATESCLAGQHDRKLSIQILVTNLLVKLLVLLPIGTELHLYKEIFISCCYCLLAEKNMNAVYSKNGGGEGRS
jgi:hypothetical protein